MDFKKIVLDKMEQLEPGAIEKFKQEEIKAKEVKAKKSKAKTLKEDTRYKKMKIKTKMYYFGDIYEIFVIPLYLFSSFFRCF